MKKRIFAFIGLIACISLSAQHNMGSIKGTVVNEESNDLLPFVNVMLVQDGENIIGSTTDFDGNFTLKPIPEGEYDLQVSYMGYRTKELIGIPVKAGMLTRQNIGIVKGEEVEQVLIGNYYAPVLDSTNYDLNFKPISRDQIEKLAIREPYEIAKTSGEGIITRDLRNNVRSYCCRGPSSVVYIDGVKVIEKKSPSKCDVEGAVIKVPGVSAAFNEKRKATTTRELNPKYAGEMVPAELEWLDVEQKLFRDL